MNGMPRPRPPHLHRETTRHGKLVWYVRIGKGSRIRILADFGTPKFDAEYQAAISGGTPAPNLRKAASSDSLAWLIERYRETTSWTDLALATRRNRENHFKQVIASAGSALPRDQESSYRRRQRPARSHAGTGAQLSRCYAWIVPMGARGSAHPHRSH